MVNKHISISLTFILLLLITPSLQIVPNPKHVALQSELVLGAAGICPIFQLHYTSDDVLMILPKSSDGNGIQGAGYYYFDKIMKRLKLQSKCEQVIGDSQGHMIHLKLNKQLKQQGYKINSTSNHVQLQFSTYTGYVYALQTLSQIVSGNVIQLGIIQDQPIVSYRGIMIDPVRHFISIGYIKRLIQAMPLSKLNMLHWSFTNDEAFTLVLDSHPELAQAGRYSQAESYSLADVRQMIRLASLNAVSIIPEFDTPAHVRGWGLAKQWQSKNITILCDGGEHYNHQLDVSISDAQKLVKQVLAEVDVLFRDSPYIHLGGDEVYGSCWSKRPAIQTFMTLHNIKNYVELQMYWRYQLKQALPASRKVVFWRTPDDSIKTGPDDVIQYWGPINFTTNFSKFSQSPLILSPDDYLYLNSGRTNIWGTKIWGKYMTWKQIYLTFSVRPVDVDPNRILGAEVCLWNQVQNQDTLENQIWMRASAFGAKIWRNQIVPLASIVKDLVKLQKILIGMGIQPSPITNQFCQITPERCFSTTVEQQHHEDIVLIE